ncbi:ATP-binding protein [Streptomyces achromogenes]|uniref:ATP-binding protein n=1 Tax=Streptomyces achromogenes TaxID=67255 RepID=UPI0036FAAB3F
MHLRRRRPRQDLLRPGRPERSLRRTRPAPAVPLPPPPRDIRQELFTELRLEGEPPSHPSEFDRLFKRTLARKPYVLVCDEAQQFSRECFEFVRHLWDTGKGKNRSAVLFVGGEEGYKPSTANLPSPPACTSGRNSPPWKPTRSSATSPSPTRLGQRLTRTHRLRL